MRLVTLECDSGASAGVLIDEHVVRLGLSIDDILARPRSGIDLESWRVSDPVRVETVTLKAPVPRPGKIIAIGMNYRDHCAEQGIDPPIEPLVFAKFPSSVIGPDSPVSWPADVTDVDWEVELAMAVGTGDDGDLDIAGFTIAIDVSARQLQARDGQFVRAKSIDTFCPMGPVLVTPDELPDPVHLPLSLEVNGIEMQRSSTDQMLFGPRELMAFCRQYFTLEPGDVILTGTPPGVGAFRKPPVYLAAGDVMVARIDAIGELRTPVSGARRS